MSQPEQRPPVDPRLISPEAKHDWISNRLMAFRETLIKLPKYQRALTKSHMSSGRRGQSIGTGEISFEYDETAYTVEYMPETEIMGMGQRKQILPERIVVETARRIDGKGPILKKVELTLHKASDGSATKSKAEYFATSVYSSGMATADIDTPRAFDGIDEVLAELESHLPKSKR